MNTIATENPTAETTPVAGGKLVDLLRLIIVYPTLVVSVLGYIPPLFQRLEAWSHDVPARKLDYAQEQLRLIKENLPCTQEAMNRASMMHGSNVAIGTAVCERGDVAIVAQSSEGNAFPNPVIVPFKQILDRRIETNDSAWNLLSPFAVAHAQERARPLSQLATVICQRQPDANGNFLRRIKKADGQCADVVTNVYSGKLVSETPAPCEPTC